MEVVRHAQAQQGMHIWPTGTCLLSKLCDELVRVHRGNLSEVVVVLPTQRQVTGLLAMLAARLTAFRPPVLMTLDPFVNEFVPHDEQSASVASDLMQELILAAIIRERQYRHLQLGHEHELKQFFNDISEYGMGALAFERLRAILSEDVFRAEGHLGNLLHRMEEIEELYHSFLALLADHRLTTPILAMAEKARILEHMWAPLPAAPAPWLYLACFTTLRAYYKPLFRMLLGKPNVSLWLSAAPELMAAVNPLAMLCAELGIAQERSPDDGQGGEAPLVARICRVHPRSSVLDEVAHAFRLAEGYTSLGCPPSQVAILLTNENRYGKIARTFASRMGLDANLAISTPLAQTAVGVWVGSLMEWFGGDERGVDLLAFMVHPITLAWLRTQAALPAPAPSREQLSMALSLALSRSGSYSRLEDHCEEPQTRRSLIAVKEALSPLFQLARSAGSKAPLRLWTRALEGVFAGFGLWGQLAGQDGGVAQSSVTAVEELLDALLEASALRDPLLSQGDFWKLVKDKMLSLETRSIGYPLKGVQVLNLIESRYVPFRVVIVLGCVEGAFPKALPKDYLIDDWLKEQIGLPGWQYVEALEDTTFQLLKARIPHLHLSYPSDDRGSTAVRSRFVEKLVSSGEAVLTAEPQGNDSILGDVFTARALGVRQDVERRGRAWLACDVGGRGHFGGSRWPLLQEVTATSLQRLIQCPYRYLMAQLGVKKTSLFEGDNKQEEGAWLHAIIQAFFTGYARGKRWLPALPERIACSAWEAMAAERLQLLTRQMAALSLAQAPLYHHLIHFAWPRFIGHLTNFFSRSSDGLYYEQSLASAHEWGLGGRGGGQLARVDLALAGDLHEFSVKGVLDRVDSSAAVFVLTDYKRQSLPSQNEVWLGVSPQLVLYALALASLDDGGERWQLDKGLVGYWSILGGDWEARGAGAQGRAWGQARGLVDDKAPSLSELVVNLKELWAWRCEPLLLADAPFAPDPGKGCTYCEYQGICRQADPHNRLPQHNGRRLHERLRQAAPRKKERQRQDTSDDGS